LLPCPFDLNVNIRLEMPDMLNVRDKAGQPSEPERPERGFADQVARLNAVNLDLTRQVADLSRRNIEITLRSRMNTLLWGSASEAESYPAISEAVSQLFPEESGAVFITRAAKNMLEAVTVWGQHPPGRQAFPCVDCHAYQCGKMHFACGSDKVCAGASVDKEWHACVPLQVRSEVLGVLHLRNSLADDDIPVETRMEGNFQLARALAGDIALGIWNIRSREALRDLSIKDPLTGLFNRRYMDESLTQEQARSLRNRLQLAVIMIDIDDFRNFNDNFGHDAGDAVLRSLGEVFRRSARGSDVACRYGGEEFVMILSPSSADGARRLAERIRQDVRQLVVTHAGRNLGGITLSLGVAIFPEQASDPAALIKAADVALYEAKNAGRDRVVMYGKKITTGSSG
jgi:diguanylate cyclase (GGDEF)-like protein